MAKKQKQKSVVKAKKATQKPIKKAQKLSPMDRQIIKAVKQNPMATNYGIGKYLHEKGISKSDHSVYSRLKKSEYLCGEIEKIRQANWEMMSREIVPEALKIHKKVLRDRNIPDKEKKDWVFQAERAEFRMDETKRPIAERVVNIDSVQILNQMLIQGDAPLPWEPERINQAEKGEEEG